MSSSEAPFFDIPYYHDYISPALARHLLREAKAVRGVSDLVEVGEGGGLESKESLQFLTQLYGLLSADLNRVLAQRKIDREFMDQRVRACSEFNDKLNRDILSEDYKTIIGLEDARGRVVLGPLSKNYAKRGGKPIAKVPEFFKGSHVTLFGPPDSAKMSINAMNAYHRKIKNEPKVVEELLKLNKDSPMWGADDEDSKTPLRTDLMDAAVNLTACFDQSIKFEGYELAKDHLSLPIKRFPGLALPSTFLFYKKNPIPLHLYDFALHLYKNWQNEKALVFYVPKLENEEEARYIHKMVSAAEKLIKEQHSSYVMGSVRLMVVLENPRAILRTHEIMDALHPYFVGASLGWHDYLASTARVFKEDHHYRIPVKADPDIVIKYIKASHLLLAEVVGSRGGIKVGGMYGILPLDNELTSPSFQITMKGFIKDVIIQLKRDLTGFWVAHPDFVRIGMALVSGWRLYKAGNKKPLTQLIESLLIKKYQKEVLDYLASKDIKGMSTENPNYVRSLIVADIKESDFIANHHPDEIRYNVFQSLQYLTDWLSGNGCVALPAIVNGVAVRVMDDLATAERSRWEVWHELHHKRFSMEDFLRIAHEELHFIRKDLSNSKKIVQVKWNEKTEKWYPVAFKIMLQLMTADKPVEFATELLMPFTVDAFRNASDPWAAANDVDSAKYQLSPNIERFNYYFEACGSQGFAAKLSRGLVQDISKAKQLILKFNIKEINEAACFHGDIGENKKTLDAQAKAEQAQVLSEKESTRQKLLILGAKYKSKFGFKFLISAKNKTSGELLEALKKRLKGSRQQELKNAAQALADIAESRMNSRPYNQLLGRLQALREEFKIDSASLAISENGKVQSIALGETSPEVYYQMASLSKSVAAAFAIHYFDNKNISLHTSVNELFAKAKSKFRLRCESNPEFADHSEWADQVTIEHLLNHTALDQHYVQGLAKNESSPKISKLAEKVNIINQPGEVFKYSGGGYIVLEHLIETLEKKSIQDLIKKYLAGLGLQNISFQTKLPSKVTHASGQFDSGELVPGGRLIFPAFAAGASATAADMAQFLNLLTFAYKSPTQRGIAHDVAVQMLRGFHHGSTEFMGAAMGLGVFVAEAGPNQLAIHQGANEGFRALFIHCFSGPDVGKGFVIFCNADNRGVLFIARAAQEILKEFKIEGIDISRFETDFNYKNLKQEEIVNLGYKKLIFDSFTKCLPEKIEARKNVDYLAEVNLAVDAQILFVTNQRFARAENLISPHEPIFDPELFGAQGKVMDSWESARHNARACEYVDLKLKKPSAIQYISLSTKYHDGNQAQFVRVLARDKGEWLEILPKQKLQGHSLLQIKLAAASIVFSEVRVEMFPDGGLTRLGLFAQLPEAIKAKFKEQKSAKSVRYHDEIPQVKKPLTIPYSASFTEIKTNYIKNKKSKIDYASRAFGGILVKASNEHYGPAVQVISPYPPLNMFDGLESARSREPGHHEEVILQLGQEIVIKSIVLDFKYFINNNPKTVSIEGFSQGKWQVLVPQTSVKAYAGNSIEFKVKNKSMIKKIRVSTFPDGGVNRIHVYSV